MLRANILILIVILVSVSRNVSAIQENEVFTGSSVLSQGKWFKIGVTNDGIYRLDFSRIKELGLEYPSNPRIYANNQGQLSYFNNDPKPDDLKEISISLNSGSDNVFNEGDYLLFYGKGTHRWNYNQDEKEYEYLRHNYSDTAWYFITSSIVPGKPVAGHQPAEVASTYTSNSFDALFIHEIETENIIKSGREWYQPVSSPGSLLINPEFTNIITTEKINFKIRLLARSSVPVSFRFYEGQSLLASKMVSEVNMLSTTGTYARIDSVSGSYNTTSTSPSYELKFYNNGETGSKAWIDYITLIGRAESVFSGNTIQISDSKSVSPGSTTEYIIRSSIPAPIIWDVTDPSNVRKMDCTYTNGNILFKANSEILRTFIIFTIDKAQRPFIKTEAVPNQNIHSSLPADMVIVCHPLFLKQAERLAQIHFENSGLVSLIVTPEQIYNEFSGGIPDIVAIRNFLRMMYLKYKNNPHSTKYLLLFGDGSFENKTLPPKNPNFIPTYQTSNSNVIVSSFTSDDFYCLLDDGEGEYFGTEDLGVGRLPVSDTTQAGNIVRKIKLYISGSVNGKWKNIISMVADDEDNNTHMIDSEGLAALINTENPSFNIDKIYLDAFRQTTSANGQSYPDATKAINDRINAGCLIFNYIGHGNELGLAHERVVKTEDINNWKNISALPLFITATCEFGRFDDVEFNLLTREISGKNSAGELVLNNPDGGGIALMTTTRIVYSSPNYILNKNIYQYAFDLDSDGNALRLGDIIRLAKLNSGDGMNKRNFSLLGDPAVRLAYPWNGKVMTDSINGIAVSQGIDSLKALSVITISGHIDNNSGNLISNFNGVVYPSVYDKISKVRTLANDGGLTMEYDTRNNILFNGKTTVENGRFRFTFMVPRDIDYSFGKGKISYYAGDENSGMAGYFDKFIVGGFNNTVNSDTTGPLINLYMNDTLFRNGGMTDKYPVLLARIEDEGGINSTGSGIGHDITITLNRMENQKIVLNSFFETDFDNYQKGKVEYKLGEMNNGKNSVTLKAWDNFNNSSEATIVFMVRTEEGFLLNNILNYPNPFTSETWITAEHNRPDKELDICISIFNLNGSIIKRITTSVTSVGYKIPPIYWDGLTDNGKKAAKGIYPYRITIKTDDNETVTGTGRLMIL